MLFEHSTLRALCLYYTSALQNFLKIALGRYSASIRVWGCNSGGFYFRPICLDTGKSHPRTLYAR